MDGLPALNISGNVIEVLRTTKENIQPGHTSSGNLGRSNPTTPSQGHLSMFNKTGQFVNPTCQ